MRLKNRLAILLFLCLAITIAAAVWAREPALEAQSMDVDLTVYNQNLALVKEHRTLDLKMGVNEIAFSDVAALIDPTTVLFHSVTDPEGTIVLEQNYEYDIVGAKKLLEKYVDRKIEAITQDGTAYAGTLLSGAEDLILRADSGEITVIKLDQVREFSFPQLPEGLISKPTLLWQLQAARAGSHKVDVTYMTEGIDWSADYVVLLNAADTAIDLNGWVTLNNNSGASYNNAKLKLVAGDIHRAQEEFVYMDGMEKRMAAGAAAPPSVEERAFFEYHLYEVKRPVTVKNHQTKQIEFTAASAISATKFFVYDGSQRPYYGYGPVIEPVYGQTSNQKVMVMLQFKNDDVSGLGVPLPKGRVRVYKADVDGTSQFIGEDNLDHTPKDENVRLYLGDAFDIIGERKQTDFRKLGDRSIEESYEVTVRNHKDEAVEVRVVEHLFRWSEWEITQMSQEFAKTDAQTIEYRLNIPANGESTVNYTVRYRW